MKECHDGFEWGYMLGTIRMAEANLKRLVGGVLSDYPDAKLQVAADEALLFVTGLPAMTRQLCEVRREIAHEAALLEDAEKGE